MLALASALFASSAASCALFFFLDCEAAALGMQLALAGACEPRLLVSPLGPRYHVLCVVALLLGHAVAGVLAIIAVASLAHLARRRESVVAARPKRGTAAMPIVGASGSRRRTKPATTAGDGGTTPSAKSDGCSPRQPAIALVPRAGTPGVGKRVRTTVRPAIDDAPVRELQRRASLLLSRAEPRSPLSCARAADGCDGHVAQGLRLFLAEREQEDARRAATAALAAASGSPASALPASALRASQAAAAHGSPPLGARSSPRATRWTHAVVAPRAHSRRTPTRPPHADTPGSAPPRAHNSDPARPTSLDVTAPTPLSPPYPHSSPHPTRTTSPRRLPSSPLQT